MVNLSKLKDVPPITIYDLDLLLNLLAITKMLKKFSLVISFFDENNHQVVICINNDLTQVRSAFNSFIEAYKFHGKDFLYKVKFEMEN